MWRKLCLSLSLSVCIFQFENTGMALVKFDVTDYQKSFKSHLMETSIILVYFTQGNNKQKILFYYYYYYLLKLQMGC
jgi:hypothetical protein